MWKVKRMNRARIVVLTAAIGAGGVAAHLASGSDSRLPPLAATSQTSTLSLALRNIADINQLDVADDDRSRQRGSINAVRYGGTPPTAIRKRSEDQTI